VARVVREPRGSAGFDTGERFGARRIAGMGLVLLGLAVLVLPRPRSRPAPNG
jgi:drug/metabolite transporter (DMT)-like permease